MREVEFAFRVTSLSLKAGQRLCQDTRVRAPAALEQPPRGEIRLVCRSCDFGGRSFPTQVFFGFRTIAYNCA